jgi:hypothetical protein
MQIAGPWPQHKVVALPPGDSNSGNTDVHVRDAQLIGSQFTE